MDRPKCTLTNEELVAKAREWITSLCQTGGRSWSLRVPVDLDRDPDMIFGELCIRLLGCPCHEPQGLVFRSAEEVFKHYGVTLTDDGHEPFDPDPTPTGGKTGHDKP